MRSSGSSRRSTPTCPSPRPMHRLLQGDVGSGKTVVAVTALLAAVQSGNQGALMAPTEVLAEQHLVSVRELARRPRRTRPGQPLRRPPAARRAAHQQGHRQRPQAAPCRSRGRCRRHRHRHPRADPDGGRLPPPRRRRHRRAAPLRRRTARRPARQGGRGRARRPRDDRHADPANGGDDGVRRPRCQRARRAATRADADRDGQRGRSARSGAGVGRRANRGRRRSSGVRRVPAHRGLREARGGVCRGDVHPPRRGRAARAAPRPPPRADEVRREGRGDGALPRRASSTCWSPRR